MLLLTPPLPPPLPARRLRHRGRRPAGAPLLTPGRPPDPPPPAGGCHRATAAALAAVAATGWPPRLPRPPPDRRCPAAAAAASFCAPSPHSCRRTWWAAGAPRLAAAPRLATPARFPRRRRQIASLRPVSAGTSPASAPAGRRPPAAAAATACWRPSCVQAPPARRRRSHGHASGIPTHHESQAGTCRRVKISENPLWLHSYQNESTIPQPSPSRHTALTRKRAKYLSIKVHAERERRNHACTSTRMPLSSTPCAAPIYCTCPCIA